MAPAESIMPSPAVAVSTSRKRSVLHAGRRLPRRLLSSSSSTKERIVSGEQRGVIRTAGPSAVSTTSIVASITTSFVVVRCKLFPLKLVAIRLIPSQRILRASSPAFAVAWRWALSSSWASPCFSFSPFSFTTLRYHLIETPDRTTHASRAA